ncbi:MAG: hypothetical protein KC680_02380 [Candidatus Peregrinibacteria bacterium]|nr:hypothetical protein [Candidatus Peregrinibacteria bacterium]MCB9808266.1 hypothetical protein [Candidatus Peribacteria bacterium]
MTLQTVPPWKIALGQVLALVTYILCFVTVIQTMVSTMGEKPFPNPFVGMALFLTTFVFSALICGSTMLGYPLILLFEKNARRSIAVLLWSALWLGILLATALAATILTGTTSSF